MKHKTWTYIVLGILFVLLIGAKEQCKIATLDMRGIKEQKDQELEQVKAIVNLAHIYTQTERQYSIYTPGKEWTYKAYFLDAKGDTIKTENIVFKTLGMRVIRGINTLWCYEDTSLNEKSVVEDDDYDVVVYPPTKQGLQFTIFSAFPQFIYYIDSPFTASINGKEWIMRYRRPNTKIFGKQQLGKVRTEYYRIAGQRNISTPVGEFTNCWQVETRGNVEGQEMYKAIYYFSPQYGFVRWEYTKPDSSQVIFDLDKVSGFE